MGTRSVRVLFEFTTVPLEAFTKQVLNRLDIYISMFIIYNSILQNNNVVNHIPQISPVVRSSLTNCTSVEYLRPLTKPNLAKDFV